MTISSSLNAGVAGLAANANRLATISDNIANSSTYGYKRVEADFQSLVLSDSGRSYTAGGVQTVTQRLIDQSGSLVSTANPTDLAVRGRGMLPVTPASEVRAGTSDPEMLLATTGSFRVDEQGYLSTSTGMILMGWPAALDGSIPPFSRDTSDGLEPVQFSLNLIGDPTTSIDTRLNLPATDTAAGSSGDPYNLSVEYFDNLGTSQSLSMTFTPTVAATGSSNEWTLVMTDSASGGAVVGEYVLTFDDSRTSGGTIASVTTVSGGTYDPASGDMVVAADGGPITVNIGAVGDTQGLSQLSDSFAPISINKDGSTVGNMTSVEVDETGNVFARFDSGVTKRIYQIPLVDLPNPNGLEALDQQTYRPSKESGAFFLWDSGEGPTGDIKSFSREESTTDVAAELTSMIQTQRAYSSNAKLIQTVDEMLQETTNIKR
ncbi:flagellar hook-basal body complex protein [Marinovum sp.]|uniref:flagellar hook protein FlgE n=1 Tax=Marinovum sp. TaxID=2024839 RepID=UPI002B26C907|nr:flagellar hook-basal body complex protein [Marinovum sp.]